MSSLIRRNKVRDARRGILKVLADTPTTVPEGCAAVLHVVTMGMAMTGKMEDTFEIDPGVHVTISIKLDERHEN